MPQRETTFVVNAPPDAVWLFIRDFNALCACIPGVERLQQLDERSVELTVREKVGVVPMIVDLVAVIESEAPPHRLHARARAKHLIMEIDVDLRAAAGGTEFRALFKVTGEGPLKAIVDRLFEQRVSERAAQFAGSLAERFDSDRTQDAASTSGLPSAPAPSFWIRLVQWLARTRKRLFGQTGLPGS